jgi:hypothetical protein
MHYEANLSLFKDPVLGKVLKRRSIELEKFLKSKGKESQILINSKEELREFLSDGDETKINDLNISIRDFVSYNVSLDEIYEILLESRLNHRKSFVDKIKCLISESSLNSKEIISTHLNKTINHTDNINELDSANNPALYYALASFNKYEDWIEIFLKNGADILTPIGSPSAYGLENFLNADSLPADKYDYLNNSNHDLKIINYIPIDWFKTKIEWVYSANFNDNGDLNLIRELRKGIVYLKENNCIKNQAIIDQICKDYLKAMEDLESNLDKEDTDMAFIEDSNENDYYESCLSDASLSGDELELDYIGNMAIDNAAFKGVF